MKPRAHMRTLLPCHAGDVPPIVAPHNLVDSGAVNAELAGNFNRAQALDKVAVHDCGNVVRRELGVWAQFAALTKLAPLAKHVVCVVLGRAQEKVRGIYAVGHVAMMAHKQVLWDGATRQNPRHAMRRVTLLAVRDLAVSVGHDCSLPVPAAVGLLYAGVKACAERCLQVGLAYFREAFAVFRCERSSGHGLSIQRV